MSATGLGRAITRVVGVGGAEDQITLSQAASATISGFVPTMLMTRVRL
jgi:hypothetical protein